MFLHATQTIHSFILINRFTRCSEKRHEEYLEIRARQRKRPLTKSEKECHGNGVDRVLPERESYLTEHKFI